MFVPRISGSTWKPASERPSHDRVGPSLREVRSHVGSEGKDATPASRVWGNHRQVRLTVLSRDLEETVCAGRAESDWPALIVQAQLRRCVEECALDSPSVGSRRASNALVLDRTSSTR